MQQQPQQSLPPISGPPAMALIGQNGASNAGQPQLQSTVSPAPTPTPVPSTSAPAAPSSDLDDAVEQAKTKYPRFKDYPIALTKGSGPGFSETFEPEDDDNPIKGKWTIQLRSKEALSGGKPLDDVVGFEMIHALQASDPKYQKFTDDFVKSMTPQQLADSYRAYDRDKKVFDVRESFDKWLKHVQAQEYIRGGVFTDVIPNWVGPKGEGRYTSKQTELLKKIKSYLQSSGDSQ